MKLASENKNHIFIALDDLRVGGIQRLTLDAAYALIDRGKQVTIISFNEHRVGDSILEVDGTEQTKLFELGIDVIYISTKNPILKVIRISKLIKSENLYSVVCHSVTAVVIFRAASLIGHRRVILNLWIHQLISLSRPVQKMKRLLYSVLASRIFFSSYQFKLEWESEPFDRLLRMLFFKSNKNRIVCRLGVHLPRVLNQKIKFPCSEEKSHLIFASRLSGWKGLVTFLSLAKTEIESHSILMSVNLKNNEHLREYGKNRHTEHVITCKPPSFVQDVYKPVHIYPTDYGSSSSYPQSIGLNVIEFTSLGIPSLVSREDVTTYPELFASGLVCAVNWSDQAQVQLELTRLLSLSSRERLEKAAAVRKFCSIEQHVSILIDYN